MSLSGCGEEVMTDPLSTSSTPVCLSLKEGKKSANAGRLLKSSGSW